MKKKHEKLRIAVMAGTYLHYVMYLVYMRI